MAISSRAPTAFSNRDKVRRQGRPGDRIALDQELVDRIVGQPGSVVAVGVAAGEAKEPLPEQFERLMPDLARLAVVRETRRQPLGQPELGVDPLEQERPTIDRKSVV